MSSGFEGVKHWVACLEKTFRRVAVVSWRTEGVFPSLQSLPQPALGCGWPPAGVSAGLRAIATRVGGSGRTASVPACAGAAKAVWACGDRGGGQQEQDCMQMLFSAAFPAFFSD